MYWALDKPIMMKQSLKWKHWLFSDISPQNLLFSFVLPHYTFETPNCTGKVAVWTTNVNKFRLLSQSCVLPKFVTLCEHLLFSQSDITISLDYVFTCPQTV